MKRIVSIPLVIVLSFLFCIPSHAQEGTIFIPDVSRNAGYRLTITSWEEEVTADWPDVEATISVKIISGGFDNDIEMICIQGDRGHPETRHEIFSDMIPSDPFRQIVSFPFVGDHCVYNDLICSVSDGKIEDSVWYLVGGDGTPLIPEDDPCYTK
jgi:hypothetical protein